MNARNLSREWRRARARRDHLANEICGYLVAGRTPDKYILSEWELATERLSRLEAKHQEHKEPQT